MSLTLNQIVDIAATNTEFSPGMTSNEIYFANQTEERLTDVIATVADAVMDKADGSHTHDGYAPSSHTHDGYAPTDHTHAPAAIGAAPASHTHDYAAANHGHSYNDLADKPNIPAAYTHPESHPATMITGLAEVATTGSYEDLTDKPNIPAAYSHPASHPASMITGLAPVATSGSYNDLDDTPTIPTIPASLPANGGNADTVDNKHASDFATAGHNHDNDYAPAEHSHMGYAPTDHEHTAVSVGAAPANHASSTTTYGVSTATNYGHSKASGTTPKAPGQATVGSETAAFARGDHVHPFQVVEKGVTTAGTGAAYTATVDGITALATGVAFLMVPHVVSTVVNPTLNVNGLGAKTIRRRVSNSTVTTVAATSANWLGANKPVRVIYDGTYWIAEFDRPNATDLYGTVAIANGGTGATTAAAALTNLGAFPAAGGTIGGDVDVEGVIRANGQQAFYYATSTASQTIGTGNATGGTTIACGSSANVNINGANVKMPNALPKTSNTYYCGNSTLRWKGIYSNSEVNVASDERLKRDIKPLAGDSLAAFIEALNVVSFNYTDDEVGEKARIGLIAQDVQRANADIAKFFVDEDENGMLGLTPANLVFPLIAAFQAQNKRIAELEAKLEKLEAK